MDRKAILKALEADPELEVLVIGAGINGAGVFRDLARQGLRVLLVDRGDFCSGASAASSHMAHGGIRYLENGEFRLVAEAVAERNRLLVNAPHLVRPLPTIIPIFRFLSGLLNAPFKFLGLLDRPSERGAFVIKVGLILYDALTRGRRVVPKHRFEGRKASLARFPALNPSVAWTAAYYDGQLLSPERLNIEVILDGEAEGGHAMALNHCPVEGAGSGAGGRVEVRLRDLIGGRDLVLRPRAIVNAAGPWIDLVNSGLGLPSALIGGTKGSHLVLDNPALLAATGGCEFFFENADGRIVLVQPWFDRVLVGTSDLPCEDYDRAICTEEEIDYFVHLAARVFPDIPVRREDIVFTFSGVRPLPRSKAKNAGQVSRDHSVGAGSLGAGEEAVQVLSLVGGKWTTFRAFAEQVSDRVLAHLSRPRREGTAALPIGGGAAWPQGEAAASAFIEGLAREARVDEKRAGELFARYGTRASLVAARLAREGDERLVSAPDWSRSELSFLVEAEKALRLDDLLLRRTTVAWRGLATADLLAEAGVIMGGILGWSGDDREAEVLRVARLMTARHGAPSTV